ncbi:MAG: septum formation initiator family protein [Peptoniphilus harei]|nr:septum formation initiator family protein [Peptoniphilus harei]MBS6719649.1 septum formation initiator family protein [Peptoniphilus harei]MDU1663507.1 septum formation initiator family protein [Peptoniphilus harei]MDU5569662.1 septum formation initiator family protein [Peptoniphilus harei]
MAKKLTKISNKSYNIYKNQILNNKPFIFTVAIVTIVFVAILILYSQIAGLDREILKQKAEIDELNKTKITLVGEIKAVKSSEQIAEEAMYKLGMVYPSEDQIVYIDSGEEKSLADINYNVFLSPIVSVLRSFTRD